MNKNLIIISIISILIAIGAIWYGTGQRSKRIIAQNNNTINVKKIYTKDSLIAIQSQAYQVNVRDIKAAHKKEKDSMNIKLTDYEKNLAHAYDVIDNLNAKLKHANAVISFGFEATHHDTTHIYVDSSHNVIIKPIHTKFLDVEFGANKDTLLPVDTKYHGSGDILLDRKYGLNKKGNDRLFICRWLFPKWTYFATTKLNDPQAEIKFNILVKF